MTHDAYETFVLALAPWTAHHTTCSRAILNDSCDCGLHQLLAELKREAEAWQHMEYVPLRRHVEAEVEDEPPAKPSRQKAKPSK